MSYGICITNHIHEKSVFCLFTMCPLFKSSRICHWNKSKEYVIRFTISFFHTYSLKFHICAHTELHICCVTHFAAENGRKFIAGWQNMLALHSYMTLPWPIPTTLEAAFERCLGENSAPSIRLSWVLFILLTVSSPSWSLSHFIIWHDAWSSLQAVKVAKQFKRLVSLKRKFENKDLKFILQIQWFW